MFKETQASIHVKLFWGGGCQAIGTAATPGLLCQPQVIMKMIVEKQTECRLAGETEVLGENLPQRHFCPSQNPTWHFKLTEYVTQATTVWDMTEQAIYAACVIKIKPSFHAWVQQRKCHKAFEQPGKKSQFKFIQNLLKKN
jgi:hypothetical protein